MKEDAVKFKSIAEQCLKHVQRLDYAYSHLAPLLPFSVQMVRKLKDEEISHLDQYIFRFSKLQDAIGQKLFPVVLESLGEEVHNTPFIDIFNRLEQLNIIEDYSVWQELRIVRNEIAHEYNENEQELSEKLNKILSSKELLKSYLTATLQYMSIKGNVK